MLEVPDVGVINFHRKIVDRPGRAEELSKEGVAVAVIGNTFRREVAGLLEQQKFFEDGLKADAGSGWPHGHAHIVHALFLLYVYAERQKNITGLPD